MSGEKDIPAEVPVSMQAGTENVPSIACDLVDQIECHLQAISTACDRVEPDVTPLIKDRLSRDVERLRTDILEISSLFACAISDSTLAAVEPLAEIAPASLPPLEQQAKAAEVESASEFYDALVHDRSGFDWHYLERMELLASVFHSAAEGIAILHANGTIAEANTRFQDLVKRTQEQIIGDSLFEVLGLQIDGFDKILRDVSAGVPWCGKVSSNSQGQACQWYRVSLSQTRTEGSHKRCIVALLSDVTQLENAHRLLERQALHDNLTGLPNRRYFRRFLHDLLAKGDCDAFSVCYLDLDDFKHVNDSLGHAAGDQLLRLVTHRLKEVVGNQAFIARFGGDEFAMVLYGRRRDDRDIHQINADLLESFRHPFTLDSNEANVGLSIGIAEFPKHGSDADSLMANADVAMYEAKSAGKNRARFFTSHYQWRSDQRRMIQAELPSVLQHGGLSLAFQPKVAAQSRRTVGCEALARWVNANGEMISPADFIPIAEKTGLILPLGDWVLNEAMKTASNWAINYPELLPIAVNISPQQLRSEHLVGFLEDLLSQYHAQPGWLEIEITENAIIEDIDRATQTLKQLRDLGLSTAIDDFGTGYSSLNYLRIFDVDKIKMDRSFVQDTPHDTMASAIAQAIISLGSGVGLTVVAEGVETEAQANFLSNVGCHEFQGFFFARPASAEQTQQWLRAKGQQERPIR